MARSMKSILSEKKDSSRRVDLEGEVTVEREVGIVVENCVR